MYSHRAILDKGQNDQLRDDDHVLTGYDHLLSDVDRLLIGSDPALNSTLWCSIMFY